MQLSRPLLRWYFRAAWNVTWPAMVAATLFVLIYQGQLSEVRFFPPLAIFLHNFIVGQALGRLDTAQSAFLYTRGFSRDRLWAHRLIAHVLCVLTTWLPACLLVWLGVRSLIQDHVFQNAYYPLFRAADNWPMLVWLMMNLWWVSIVQYACVRRWQPTRDVDAGFVIALGLFVAGAVDAVPAGAWIIQLGWAIAIVINGIMLWGSWRLHRSVEVYSP